MKDIFSFNEFLYEERRKMIFKRRTAQVENTEDYSDIITNIRNWIDQETPRREADAIGEFLIKNKKRIDVLSKTIHILRSPLGIPCYRGLEKVNNNKFVIDALNKGHVKIEESPGYDGMIRAIKIEKYPYEPTRLAQSWSIDPDVSWKFSNSGIILETVSDSSFIMDPTYTSKINKEVNKATNEEEIIHIGKDYKNVILYVDINSVEEGNPLYEPLQKFLNDNQ